MGAHSLMKWPYHLQVPRQKSSCRMRADNLRSQKSWLAMPFHFFLWPWSKAETLAYVKQELAIQASSHQKTQKNLLCAAFIYLFSEGESLICNSCALAATAQRGLQCVELLGAPLEREQASGSLLFITFLTFNSRQGATLIRERPLTGNSW